MNRVDAAQPAPPMPSRGRPRSERRSKSVLAATLHELIEHGIGGTTIEAVAARAGVSKVTLYRRWPDKIALTLAALDELPELVVPDTGSLLDDLCALRNALVGILETTCLGDVLPALMAERRRSEHRDAIGAYIDQRSEAFRIIVERASARGEITSTMDASLVSLMFSSPLAMSLMTRDAPLTHDEWTTVATTIIDGLNPTRTSHEDSECGHRPGERERLARRVL